MYIFGISIDLLDFIALFFVILVTYIIILEYEFKQILGIVKKYDDEEMLLGKNIRELKEELKKLRDKI
ncbi:MAG: hypothetical protein GQ477_05000 [Nanohaloarchaea archaeon]|nr:hypothetical protein [Candidatus Nanohaloarchaea archaeon]